MKTIYSSLLLLTLTLLSSTLFAQTTFDGSFGGRNYKLRIPPAASSGDLLPLVVSMHGFTQNAAEQEAQTGMNAVADTANFFVVYPNGTLTFLFLRGWNASLGSGGVDDVGYLNSLVDDLIANYNIDPDKIFATGFSNGGGMSVALACATPGRYKAISPVGAAIDPGNAALCNLSDFPALIQFHGTSDAIVPYSGGFGQAPAVDYFRAWTAQDACGSVNFENLPNPVVTDGSSVSRATLEACDGGVTHQFYRINSGDHSVPGPGGQNQDINSSVEQWLFFRKNGGAPSARLAAPLEATLFSPNPAATFTQIQTGVDADWSLTVFDLQGRVVRSESGNGPQGWLDVSNLSSGSYVVALQSGESIQRSRLQVVH